MRLVDSVLIGWNDGHPRPFDVAIAGLCFTLPGWRRRGGWGLRGRRGLRVIVALAINRMSACVPERKIGNARQGAEKPFIFPAAERLCDLTQACHPNLPERLLIATVPFCHAGARIHTGVPPRPPLGI